MNLKKKWENEKCSEIEFWRSWFQTKGLDWPDDFKHRLDSSAYLQDRLSQCLPKQSDVSILDVGAGPLTKLGKVCPMHNLHITAVDALADDYDRLLMEFGITPLVRTQSCDVENLLDIFSDHSFDLVYMCNALDHSYDAIEGIRQMLAVAKGGCYVVLDHAVNEGKNANYGGLHSWNLCEENGDFVIWNQVIKVNITEMLKDVADVDITTDLGRNFVKIFKHCL